MAFFLLFGVKKRKDFAFRIGLRQKKVTHSCARSYGSRHVPNLISFIPRASKNCVDFSE